MALTINVGETRPVRQNGTPMASATQPDLPKGPGLAATIKDDGAGNLVCVGNFAGSLPFNVYGPGGAVVQHVVTVTGADFDWDLGDPV